jgi:DNA-binding CsgD family transcriptional regulator
MGPQPPDRVAETAARLQATFGRVNSPMLIVDDERWYVVANAAAHGLLDVAPDEIPWRRLDEFTAHEDRARLADRWDAFLVGGGMEGRFHISTGTGNPLPVEFGATANVLPGRHLLVVMPPAGDGPVLHDGPWVRLVAPNPEQEPLTAREHEVMSLVATGLQGGEIAAALFVSPETVKSHVQHAMAKLGAHTRAHAVAIALSTGQIEMAQGQGSDDA